MIAEETRQIILKELPKIIKTDDEVRRLILDLASNQFADKRETESRFDRILNELQRDREEQSKKWEENQKVLNDMMEEIKEMRKRMEANDQRMEIHDKKFDEQIEEIRKINRRMEIHDKKFDEQIEEIRKINRRMEIHDKKFDEQFEETRRREKRLQSSVGALGARWGLYSEASFRNGLKAILEETFQVQVIHVNEWDESGVVFGRPDQVELDIIIKNGHLIICEIKSSISKSEMHVFYSKVRFYEDKHGRKCDRMLVISPMVDSRAEPVAEALGIEVYTHSYDVKEIQEGTEI